MSVPAGASEGETLGVRLRPDALTSDDRLFCHVYGRGARSKDQLVSGWPYSFVAALETGRTLWVSLLDAMRLGPADDATAVTANQLRDTVERLLYAGQWNPGDPEILVVMDSGYDVAYLSHALADLPVALLGRLRSERVMLRDPGPARPGPRGGRPRWHGGVLALSRPETWLIIAAHTQLRLARALAEDLRRPWERPATEPRRLTPARVRRGFRNIRATAAHPATAPKPTRPGPGQPPGSKNKQRAKRHDVGKIIKRAESIKDHQTQRG